MPNHLFIVNLIHFYFLEQGGDGKSDLVGSSLPFSAAAAAAAASAAALSSLRGGGPGAAEAAAAAYHNLPLLHHLHQQNPFFGGHHGPHSHPHGPGVLSPFSAGAFRPLTPGEAFSLANPHAGGLQVQNSGKGPSSNGKEPLPFNLSRYNPLFTSISSMAESSMAAGRLLFSGNGQRMGQEPESPPHHNDLSPAAAAGRSQDDAGDGNRENTATPSSDISGTERSTPDDMRGSRRKCNIFFSFFTFSVAPIGG